MLAGISSASIQGRIALGPRAGARVWRVGEEPDAPWVLSNSPRHAHIASFDLHANVAVPAANRARLEQLCRYLHRGSGRHSRPILDHLAASAERADRAPPLGTRGLAILPAQVRPTANRRALVAVCSKGRQRVQTGVSERPSGAPG